MNRLYAGTFSTVCRHKTTHIIIIFIFVILHYCNTGQYFEIFLYSLTNKTIFFFPLALCAPCLFCIFFKMFKKLYFSPLTCLCGGKREGLIQVAWGTGTWGTYGTFSHAMGSESAWASWCSQWCGGRGHPIVRGQEGLTVSLIGTHAQEMIRS